MSCDLSSGRVVDCKDQVGGIKTVYIGNYADMPAGAAWLAASNDTVTAIEAQTFYQFDVRPETATLSVSFQSDPASGTTFFEQSLSVTLQKLDATDIADIKALTKGRPNIWVEDNNGNNFLLGAVHGCNVTGQLELGTGFGDFTGYRIDCVGREANPVFYAADLSTVTNLTISA